MSRALQNKEERKRALEALNARTSSNVVAVKEYYGLSHQQLAERMGLKNGQELSHLLRPEKPAKITDKKLLQFSDALGLDPTLFKEYRIQAFPREEHAEKTTHGWHQIGSVFEGTKDGLEPVYPEQILLFRKEAISGQFTLKALMDEPPPPAARSLWHNKAPAIERAGVEMQEWLGESEDSVRLQYLAVPSKGMQSKELLKMMVQSPFTVPRSWIVERGDPDNIGLVPLRDVYRGGMAAYSSDGYVAADMSQRDVEREGQYLVWYKERSRLARAVMPHRGDEQQYLLDGLETVGLELMVPLTMQEWMAQNPEEAAAGKRKLTSERFPVSELPVGLVVLAKVVWYCADV